MKKLGIFAAICIVVGVMLISISMFVTRGNKGALNSKAVSTNVERTYECKNKIDDIEASVRSSSLKVIASDVDKPVVICYENDYEKYQVEEKGSKLTITKLDTPNISFGVNFNFDESGVIVYIPKEYGGELEAECSSGAVSVEDFNGKELKVGTSSGSIKVSGANVAGDAGASSSSGSIKIDGITCEKLTCTSTSGSVYVNDATVEKDVCFDTTSGAVKFDSLKAKGDIECESTSGSVRGSIVGSEADYSIRTKTTSGSCNLTDSKGGSKNLNVKTTSGSIHIDFEN